MSSRRHSSRYSRAGRLLAAGLVALASPASLGAQTEALRDGPLTFVYWPGQAGAARALAEAYRDAPPFPGLPHDVLANAAITVYLAPDASTFQALAPGAPDWSGGIAFPEGDRVVLPTFGSRAGDTPMTTILRHELAHIALRRYLDARVPRWFHEGYAQLASGSWDADEAWTLRLAIVSGRVPPLDSLTLDFRRQRIDVRQAYLLSYTAVQLLYRRGSDAGFTRLLERWRDTGDLDQALRRTYGVTLLQFEKAWRADVKDRFGWLLVLSQTTVFWATLAILLIALGYLNRQRKKRKLAELEARVRARRTAEGLDEPDASLDGLED